MPFTVKLNLNAGAMNQMLKSPGGLVGTVIHKVGTETLQEAKSMAPVDTYPGSHRGPHMRDKIIISLWPGPRNSIEIAANTKYAIMVHEGARPHGIDGNPLLVFPWKKHGGIITITPHVNHPGNKGNPFLFNALKRVIKVRF